MRKPIQETVGHWVWYVRMWKEANPDKEVDYKALMAQYVRGETYDSDQQKPSSANHQAREIS